MTTTMADRMAENNSQENPPPTPDQVRRGRRMAVLLFVIGFGPMIVATIMFYTGWLNPGDYSNNGELIMPAVPVEQLNLEGADGQPLAERFGPETEDSDWMLMVVADHCAEECEQLLYLARQVNIALGKNANRVDRAAYLGSMSEGLGQRWQDEYSSMERLMRAGEGESQWPENINPAGQPRILLVDPFGNVMMHFGSEHSGGDMLEDLKHLLKLSQIG